MPPWGHLTIAALIYFRRSRTSLNFYKRVKFPGNSRLYGKFPPPFNRPNCLLWRDLSGRLLLWHDPCEPNRLRRFLTIRMTNGGPEL